MSARGLAGRMRAVELRNWSCLGYCHNRNQMPKTLNFSLRSQWPKVLTVSRECGFQGVSQWNLDFNFKSLQITSRCYANALIAQIALLVLKLHISEEFSNKKVFGKQPGAIWSLLMYRLVYIQHSPSGAGRWPGRRSREAGQRLERGGGAMPMEESRANPAKSLNPVEFLSSSAAPLGGVRSLWRERGKTGPVRNKAPNSHDMFS